eukprot:TRINITY_DN3751_c0_g2_i3.p1 TRINITY_DN3751_c0_g2~~TRINITY_DN3751_c0_g2_i3.p1  ORF type:complete len:269 (-),score=37.38 TRINITY_DN3751_c0_g2_i3:115-921(-)
MQYVPLHVLSTIFESLTLKELLIASTVCKNFYEAANLNSIYMLLFQNHFGLVLSNEAKRLVFDKKFTWKEIFKSTYAGQTSYRVRIANRDYKVNNGKIMSCFDAKIVYNPKLASQFEATYINTLTQEVAEVDLCQVRAVPDSLRDFDVFSVRSECEMDLKVNDSIEIQWKGNPSNGFGWWYGVVGEVNESEIIFLFKHFSASSSWYSIRVPNKKRSEMIPNTSASGYVGGWRKLGKEETKEWELYTPHFTIPSSELWQYKGKLYGVSR